MKDQELVSELSGKLGDLAELLKSSAEAKEVLARDKAELEATEKALVKAKEELSSANAGLSEAQVANSKSHDQEIFNKQGQLRELTDRIKAAKTEHDLLTANMKADQAHYATVIAGIEALREKLR